jgi:hypothetical protein
MASEGALLAISWPKHSFGHSGATYPSDCEGVATGATGCDRWGRVPVAIVTRSLPAIYAPIAPGAPRPSRYFFGLCFFPAPPPSLFFFNPLKKVKRPVAPVATPHNSLAISELCLRQVPPPTCRTCRRRPQLVAIQRVMFAPRGAVCFLGVWRWCRFPQAVFHFGHRGRPASRFWLVMASEGLLLAISWPKGRPLP